MIIELMDTYVKICKNSKMFITISSRKIKVIDLKFKNSGGNNIIIANGNSAFEIVIYKFDEELNTSVLDTTTSTTPITNEINNPVLNNFVFTKFLNLVNTDIEFRNKLQLILEREILSF